MKKLTYGLAILCLTLKSCNSPESQTNQAYETALNHFLENRLDLAFQICDSLIKTHPDPQILAKSLYLRGHIYNSKDSVEELHSDFRRSRKLFIQLRDHRYISKLSYDLGELFYDYDAYSQALGYFNNALEHAQKEGNKVLKANALYGKGKSLSRLMKLDKALLTMYKARDLEQSLKRLEYFIDIQISIGIIHHLAGNHDLAIEQNWKAINSASGTGFENKIKAMAYNNIGDIYLSKNEFQEAFGFLNKALGYEGRTNSQIAVTYNNLGRYYQSTGEVQLAARSFKKSMDLNVFKVDMEEIATSIENLKSLQVAATNKDSLIAYQQMALDITMPRFAVRKKLERFEMKDKLLELDSIEARRKMEEEYDNSLLLSNLILIISFLLLVALIYLLNKRHRWNLTKEMRLTYETHKKSIKYYTKELAETKRKLKDY